MGVTAHTPPQPCTVACRTLDKVPKSVSDLPSWNYDGSSTGQAPGTDSEVYLMPRAIYKDPFRGGDNILVMCDTYEPPRVKDDNSVSDPVPLPTNTRHACAAAMEKAKDEVRLCACCSARTLPRALALPFVLQYVSLLGCCGSRPLLDAYVVALTMHHVASWLVCERQCTLLTPRVGCRSHGLASSRSTRSWMRAPSGRWAGHRTATLARRAPTTALPARASPSAVTLRRCTTGAACTRASRSAA